MRAIGAAVSIAGLASLLAACKPPTIQSVGGQTPGEGGNGGNGPAGGGGKGGPGSGGQGGPASGGQDGPGFFQVPDGGGSGVDGARCNRLDVKFEKATPTVAIVVDRSSSMLENYGTGTRWAALKNALIGSANGLIRANEQDMRFGLVMYTGLPSSSSCPALEPQIGQLSFTLGSSAAITAVYEPAVPSIMEKGETPTGETIVAVTAALSQLTEPGPKFILLATDGEPDTCPGTCAANTCPVADRPAWPRDPNCGQDRSISAVQAAYAKGIRTFVIGIGTDVGALHLQSLANAGAGLPVFLGTQANWLLSSCAYLPAQLAGTYVTAATPMNARFFQATDQTALGDALKTILSVVRSCKFTLKGMVDLPNAGSGQVLLDGRPLVYGDPNGWRMNSPTELEVVGEACAELETKANMLSVGFPCDVYIE